MIRQIIDGWANQYQQPVVPSAGNAAVPAIVDQLRNTMAIRGGQPIMYGTPEAKALALQGLQRVAAHFGTNSHQFQRASQAAAGVLGPDYVAPQDAFSTQSLAGLVPNQNAKLAAARALLLNALSGGNG